MLRNPPCNESLPHSPHVFWDTWSEDEPLVATCPGTSDPSKRDEQLILKARIHGNILSEYYAAVDDLKSCGDVYSHISYMLKDTSSLANFWANELIRMARSQTPGQGFSTTTDLAFSILDDHLPMYFEETYCATCLDGTWPCKYYKAYELIMAEHFKKITAAHKALKR